MSQLFYVTVILVLLYFSYRVMKKVKPVPVPEESGKPTVEVPNDRIILIENVTGKEVIDSLNFFCALKKKEGYSFPMRITTLSDKRVAVTFPYNIKLGRFLELAENLLHPLDVEWEAHVLGWSTITPEDIQSDLEDIIDKKIMVYESEDYALDIVTEDNKAFCFSNYTIDAIEIPEKEYRTPEIQFSELEGKFFEDIL